MSVNKKKSAKKLKKILKVKRIPPGLVAAKETLPEPVRDLVEAIEANEVAEISFVETVEPSRWDRLCKWFAGE